jgi:uncharacterized protein
VFWLTKAADQSEAGSQYELGVRYEMGQGVPGDKAIAINWYQKAAAQGNQLAKDALNRLAVTQP